MDPGILAAVSAVARAVESTLGTVAAVYTRGNDQVDVALTMTSSAAWLASPDGSISTRINQAQFIVDPAALDFGDGPIDPEAGDQVALTVGAVSYVFEVRPPESAEPCFAPVDPMWVRIRFHAKLLSRTVEE